MATTIDLLNKQIKEIPLLRDLANTETPAFKQWSQVTITIIERKLGKKKADDFPSFYNFWPPHMGPWDDDELKQSLLTGLDLAESYLKGLIQEIELLGEENTQRPSSNDLPKLKFGDAGLQGHAGGGGSVFIQAEHFNIAGDGRISADGGNHIVSTQGSHSPVNINYGTINESTAAAVNDLTELMRKVGDSHLREGEKRQLIGNAEIVKASIIQPTPDKTTLQKAWDGLKTASSIAGVVNLLRSIGNVVLPLLSTQH